MARALWHGCVLAESAQCQELEGNLYFPRSALHAEYFRASAHVSHCPWKGEAHYYDLVVAGVTNANAAWYYPDPKPAAAAIRDCVAFWHGVVIER